MSGPAGRRSVRAVSPTREVPKTDPRFDRRTYRRRNIVERLLGWFEESRRLATRFERLAVT